MLSVYQLPHGGRELIKADKPVSEMDTCSVCLGQFLSKSVVETNCNHLFHSMCLKSWINTKIDGKIVNDCPLCRRNISVLRSPLNRMEQHDKKQLATLCLSNSRKALEEYLNGDKGILLGPVRTNLQIASDNGLEAEAKPYMVRCRLEMAKQALEEYLNGDKDKCLSFVRMNLQKASDNGLEAEAKPYMVRCRLEMAKQALEEYLNGDKDKCLSFVRMNLQKASDNGLEAEAKPFMVRCRLEMAKQALEERE